VRQPLDFGAARRKRQDDERSRAVSSAIEAKAAAKAARAAKTYTRADVDHRVWRSSAIAWAFGIICGVLLTFGLGAMIYERSAETTARQASEVFARGVAVGQVVGEDPEDKGVERPGREPKSAPPQR
jgi:hypothetical protein